MNIPYPHLDPGVRDLVRQLADLGFHPTDSGDGVSKAEIIAEGCAMPFLHVFMTVEPATALLDEADRLHDLLPSLCVPDLTVEASYRPSDGLGVLMLAASSAMTDAALMAEPEPA